jgi:hypothetical protein
MRDREERKRAKVHSDDRRVGVQQRVHHQVTALVHAETQRRSGKKLHSVDHTMLIG